MVQEHEYQALQEQNKHLQESLYQLQLKYNHLEVIANNFKNQIEYLRDQVKNKSHNRKRCDTS
jgi:CRISPR/Cas system-associated endoribonuclease Cas2